MKIFWIEEARPKLKTQAHRGRGGVICDQIKLFPLAAEEKYNPHRCLADDPKYLNAKISL